MDDIDTCSIRGHEYGSLLNERGGHICLNCGHVDEDYERPDEWQENDWEGWNDDTPNDERQRPGDSRYAERSCSASDGGQGDG